jgi:hypothetical protein
VTADGVATKLANLGVHLEGVTTVPDDPARYGPWAGKILAGAEGLHGVFAIDPQARNAGVPDPEVTFFELGIKPEDIDLIPENENFFVVEYAPDATGRLWAAPARVFRPMVGDILMVEEFGAIWRVRWTGRGFEKRPLFCHHRGLLAGHHWEHAAFAPLGLDQFSPLHPVAYLQGSLLPASPCPVGSSWQKVSGPGSVFFQDASALQTEAAFTEVGTYVLRLTGSLEGRTISSETTVIVLADTAPTVEAGLDQQIRQGETASLRGAMLHEGEGPPSTPVTYQWEFVSSEPPLGAEDGPPRMALPDVADPLAASVSSFPRPGKYVFRLTAVAMR